MAPKSNFKRKSEPSRFKRTPKLTLVPKKEKTLERRTAQNKRHPIKYYHALPNEIVVPSPFGVYSRKEKLDYLKNPLVLRYGKIEMRISGRKLNVKDGDVFIALTELAVKYEKLNYITSVTELCGKLGTAYTHESKESIKNSLRRLREAFVETIQFNDDGKEKNADWIFHGMISYAAGKNDQICITMDPAFNRLFGEKFMTSINIKFRLGLKKDVAKQLYYFYQRQISARKKQTKHSHKIGLEKLCDLIGVDRDRKRPLSAIRELIKNGLEELKRQSYLYSYSLENDLLETVIKPEKRQLQEPKKKKPDAVEPIVKTDQEEFSQGTALLKYLKKETGAEVKGGFASAYALQIQAIGEALKLRNCNLWHEFVNWLKEQSEVEGWLKTIHKGTLNPDKNVFSRFMTDQLLKMPSASTIDKHFKLLTESEIEKEQRRKKERAKEAEQERKHREYQKGIDWAEDCVKTNFKDLKDQYFDISDMRRKLENEHGKNWQKVFEKLVKAVESKHQKIKDQRNGTYSNLFRINGSIWNETTQK